MRILKSRCCHSRQHQPANSAVQGAVKGLTKLVQGNQQNSQTSQIPQYVPHPVQNPVHIPVQNDLNTLPQASQGQSSANSQGSRGGRVGYKGRGGRGRGRGRGGLILCYWCRDFLPKEQANHKVAQCPYQKQAKNDWWKSQLGNVQGESSAPQPENKEN